MKKEDLCMLLLVVALLLIVSRSTNIFEGVDETLGTPDIADIFGIDEGQGIELDLITDVVVDFKHHVYKKLKEKVKKFIN